MVRSLKLQREEGKNQQRLKEVIRMRLLSPLVIQKQRSLKRMGETIMATKDTLKQQKSETSL
jgi:hypothetical protein